ncbi:putative protein-serine/threonine phosphatase [Helianthus anomalus]
MSRFLYALIPLQFPVFVDFKEHTVYVKRRSYHKEFLERVSEMFQVVVFTASQSIYAKQLLGILDPNGKIIPRCKLSPSSHCVGRIYIIIHNLGDLLIVLRFDYIYVSYCRLRRNARVSH